MLQTAWYRMQFSSFKYRKILFYMWIPYSMVLYTVHTYYILFIHTCMYIQRRETHKAFTYSHTCLMSVFFLLFFLFKTVEQQQFYFSWLALCFIWDKKVYLCKWTKYVKIWRLHKFLYQYNTACPTALMKNTLTIFFKYENNNFQILLTKRWINEKG